MAVTKKIFVYFFKIIFFLLIIIFFYQIINYIILVNENKVLIQSILRDKMIIQQTMENLEANLTRERNNLIYLNIIILVSIIKFYYSN